MRLTKRPFGAINSLPKAVRSSARHQGGERFSRADLWLEMRLFRIILLGLLRVLRAPTADAEGLFRAGCLAAVIFYFKRKGYTIP